MGQGSERLTLLQRGFIKIAEVCNDFQLELWWHPNDKIEISLFEYPPSSFSKESNHM
jgi:hypothetical protein